MAMYECMALVEPTAAAKEWDKVVKEIEATVEKHGAKTKALNKWGDRKLAYPIKKLNRATYVISYFEGPEDAPAKIKSDLVLSEFVMRSMITRHEGEMGPMEAPPDEPRRPRPFHQHNRR